MDTELDIRKVIFELENKFPVDKWRVNGIDLWPIIRVKLQGRLNAGLGKGLTRNSSGYIGYPSQSISKKIKYFFKSVFLPQKLKKVDFIGVSTFSHRSSFNQKHYNKFYDPLLEEVNNNGLIIEHNSKEFYRQHPIHNANKVVFFEDYYYFYRVVFAILERAKLFSPLKKITLPDYQLFLQELNNLSGFENLDSEFTLKKLEPQINSVLVYKKTYLKLLKKTNPKYAFQVCHYNINSIALSMASKQLNIPSIEIQHGGQPDIHMAYSKWKKVPKEGYNTLPKIYWHWDVSSQNNMQKWLSDNEFHSSVVLGNIWMDYMLSHSKKSEKEYILYSLQPFSMEQLFPSFLIEQIKKENAPKWWIRLHPTDNNRKAEFTTFFEENNLSYLIVFDDGSIASLPETLNQSLLHVTYNSGTVIEADNVGLKSIALDLVNSPIYYQELIEKKQVELVSRDNFGEQIQRLSSNHQQTMKISKGYLNCFNEISKLN